MRQAAVTGDAGDQAQVAMPLREQGGQHSVQQIQSAVVVHRHVLFHAGQVVFGGTLGLVDTRAIHHHVQTMGSIDGLRGGLHRLFVGHVQRQRHAARVLVGKCLQQSRLAS